MIFAEKAQARKLGNRQLFCVVFSDIFEDQLKFGGVFIFKLRPDILCLPVGQQECYGTEQQSFEHHFVAGMHFSV